MNKFLLSIVLILFGHYVIAQNLEVETFGIETDKPIIFLHGGPGYNSVAFEKTTANKLTENGFFVISYDRRGEGRNQELKAEYTFAQTIDDLNQIYETYNLSKATLIGHSFGGVVGTLYADAFP
jgi:proline iminopeptidase